MASIKDRNKTWKFTFTSDEKGEHVFLYDPLEWRETEYAIERNNEDGLIFAFSGDYTYPKDAYDYLDSGLAEYGILWKVYLKLEYKNNHSFVYNTAFENRKLDFTSIIKSAKDGNVYEIPLTDSLFYENIKARENELIPYSRLFTLDGAAITPYTNEYEDVTIYGQEIATKNELSILQSLSIVSSVVYPSISHTNTLDNWISTIEKYSGGVGPAPSYIAPSEQWVEDRNFFIGNTTTGTIKGSITVSYTTGLASFQTFFIHDYKTLTPIQVVKETSSYGGVGVGSVTLTLDYEFDSDTRLTLYCGSGSPFDDIYLTVNDITILDKQVEDTIEHVSLFQFHDRILTSITGVADSFISSVLDTGGKWAHVYVSNGYLYRQYDSDEAQLSGKWKELTENISRTLGLSYGMVTVDGVRKIICEEKDYFYKDEVGLVIDKIQNDSLTISLDIDQYYSSVISGTNKKEYEERSGLTSFATKAEYTTFLGTFNNPFDLSTTYQKDGNWMEYTRRLLKDEYENTDSKYDNDVCLMETYDTGAGLIQRTGEDFDTITGIDDITTPINLNLTPARPIYKLGKWIRTGLEKYLGQTLTVDIGFGPEEIYFPNYIKFNNSEVKTALSTVRSDEGIEVFENEDIDPNALDESIMTGDIAECLGDVSYEMIVDFETDPYRKIQIPNEIDGGVIQGWVKKLSTKPIGDSLTNISIYVARDVVEAENTMIWNSGEDILWNDDESILWNG